MYPLLKVQSIMVTVIIIFTIIIQELHTSSEWLFTDYLDSYNESLKMKATPQCLHPSDIPTIKFLVDLCVHVSALPVSQSIVSSYY